ncbi:MAG: Helicase associated domain protein, partial [Clostridia bacterium]|nr:Helicase associated domain protein [Clostridia bacterium]
GNLADESRREELYNVLANLNFKCIYSDTLLVGGGQKIHLDHIIPVNLGGPTDDWNILPICGSCNSSKSDSHLLDWWEKEHTPQDEHKLVYIFEYMANRLLKSLNTKGVKVVTTLTDDEIRKAIELENKERQQEESKQQTIDLEDDIEDDYEDVEEVKDQKIKRLDAITFLYQMLNHIKQNKQYIISPDNLNQGVLDTPSEKDIQRLIDKKFKKLEKLFNSIYKQNKRLTGVKTDIQLLDEQRKMVEYIKNLDIVSYYHISYTYFDELQQMLDQGKTDKEIQEFCYEHDRAFNFTQFYNELMAYKKKFGNLEVPRSYTNKATGYKLGQTVSNIRHGKKILDEWNKLGEEKYKTKKPIGHILTHDKYHQLEAEGFVWDATISFDYEKFCKELMIYKKEHGDLLVPQSYINKETGYRLGQTVSHIRQGKKKLDRDALSEEEKAKTNEPTGYILLTEQQYKQLTAEGVVWDATISFDYEEFYNELMAYKDKFGDMLVHQSYINKATGYKLGQIVRRIRQGKKKLDRDALSEEEKAKTNEPTGYILLTEEQYKQLTDEKFIWQVDRSFDYEEFYKELMIYKQEYGNLEVPQSYINKETSYKLGRTVSNIRTGKKTLDEWKALNKEEQAKTKEPKKYVLQEDEYTQLTNEGFIWVAACGRKKKQIAEQGLSA